MRLYKDSDPYYSPISAMTLIFDEIITFSTIVATLDNVNYQTNLKTSNISKLSEALQRLLNPPPNCFPSFFFLLS